MPRICEKIEPIRNGSAIRPAPITARTTTRTPRSVAGVRWVRATIAALLARHANVVTNVTTNTAAAPNHVRPSVTTLNSQSSRSPSCASAGCTIRRSKPREITTVAAITVGTRIRSCVAPIAPPTAPRATSAPIRRTDPTTPACPNVSRDISSGFTAMNTFRTVSIPRRLTTPMKIASSAPVVRPTIAPAETPARTLGRCTSPETTLGRATRNPARIAGMDRSTRPTVTFPTTFVTNEPTTPTRHR